MAYANLTDDALLEIALYLDYHSIISWSQVSRHSQFGSHHPNQAQTSRRHYGILLQSKHILINVVKSWDFAVPLGLPVHLTEQGLTTADIRKAICRAVALDLAWNRREFRALNIGARPLDLRKDFPNCMANSVQYLHGLGLALVSIQTISSIKYIAIYQISPPQKVAVWDAKLGNVTCHSNRWIDIGGKVKQLVVAICVERPGWLDLGERNSMEVYTLDIAAYLSHKSPIQFKAAAMCYWRDPFTHVTLSDHTSGGLVFTEGVPVILSCLEWRTGITEHVIVSTREHYLFAGIEDYEEDIKFNHRRSVQLLYVKDWVGIIQYSGGDYTTDDGTLRCLLVPMRVGYPTYSVTGFSPFDPFRIRAKTIAIGVEEGPPDTEIGFLVGGQATIMPSTLHKDEKVVFVEVDHQFPAHNVCVVDFRSITARHPDTLEPGFHRFPTPKMECIEEIMEFPKLGGSGHSFARSHAGDLPAPQLLLHQLPFSYSGNQREERVATVGISMMQQSFVSIDDAAGVVCTRHDLTEVVGFYRLE